MPLPFIARGKLEKRLPWLKKGQKKTPESRDLDTYGWVCLSSAGIGRKGVGEESPVGKSEDDPICWSIMGFLFKLNDLQCLDY
jgi:hypothetical protein